MRVEEHTIELGGAPVFYRRAAAGAVPTLYLHGVPTSSDDWTGLLARTGGVAPDLPGFGRSGKGGNLDYSIGGHAGFVEALLDRLGITRVELVAHDWGAAGGLLFAQRHPERVGGIVLVNALPLLEDFRWHRLARLWRTRGLGELAMGATNRRLLSRTLRRGCVRPDVFSDARLEAVWEQFDQGTQRAILKLHRASGEAELAAAGSGLGELGVAALVIWGERDPWLPAALAGAYARRLPGASTQLVADAGHWPWLERPEVADRIAGFLGRER